MDEPVFTARIASEMQDIAPEAWNAVANPVGAPFDPFLTWEFLEALEASGAAVPETGWSPCHIVIEDPNKTILAAMPMYAKTHSQGEFVFDHSWADAYQRAGGDYFPKLLAAVPFTPVTGRRLLTKPGPDQLRLANALVSAAIQIAAQNDFSSLHINFVEPGQAEQLKELGLLIRNDQQFHWRNDGYKDFGDFLEALSSSKRKNLRKERAKAQSGLTFQHLTGDDIKAHHWDAFFEFYMDTGARKWGYPYLNRETLTLLGERLAEHILLILACEDNVPIAGALNFIGSDTLYGRYWGCTAPRPFLHFETCYYQAIDFAIANALAVVEAGAQGGHKLARGYAPVTTTSAHWIAHKGLRDAIDDYLARERQAVAHESAYLTKRTPFKKDA
ncbi:MAG: GNAT family N-acetyltransferase [Hyphomonas sp.]|nr:GNAT family N-acetyltransferase [Hyphomonas sp.]